MKSRALTTSALDTLFFAVLISVAPFTVAAQIKEPSFAPNELLVRSAPGISERAARRKIEALGGKRLEALGKSGWMRIHTGTEDVADALKRYRSAREFSAIQPNFYYRLAATPNDPLWGNASLYGLPKISAPAAWDVTTGSSSVVVAVIDTGTRYTHEDLSPNMWTNPGEINGNGVDDDGNGFADDYYGYDFYYNDPDPVDEHGHGTHVAGTIGAAGNNSLGVAGVNWNVKIMAIKIYDADGFGTTSAMLVNAYEYIRLMKAAGVNIRVTNNSYSGCTEACGYDQATKDGIDALGDAGILNVFAAGNSGFNNDSATQPDYPARYDSPSILSVAASDSNDNRAGFSNWGAQSVDIAAPGLLILSTTAGSNSSYGLSSGTSMAAPHAAGAAALLAAAHPSLSAASLKATLMNTADALTSWGATPIRTNGRLNVAAAIAQPTTCSFELSTTNITAKTKGGYYGVEVSAPANCDYRIVPLDSWLRLDGVNNGTGAGTVRFRLTVNPQMTRKGTILIGGQAVTVIQSRM